MWNRKIVNFDKYLLDIYTEIGKQPLIISVVIANRRSRQNSTTIRNEFIHK